MGAAPVDEARIPEARAAVLPRALFAEPQFIPRFATLSATRQTTEQPATHEQSDDTSGAQGESLVATLIGCCCPGLLRHTNIRPSAPVEIGAHGLAAATEGGLHVKRGTPMIAARSVAEASGQRFVARLEVTRDHPLSGPRYRRHIEIACEITQEA
jgi:hypothetical protein